MSVGLLWWRQAPGKGVLPGVTYGLLPLGAGGVAKLHGRFGMGFACGTSCMHAPSLALITGAIASECVGLHGIVGMARGIAVGIVPMMLLR